MIQTALFRQTALSLPSVTEDPHFEKAAFKVGKKIFATMPPKKGPAMVKLSLEDQDVFCLSGDNVVYPVPNAWGKKGATFVDLDAVKPEMLTELIKAAYCNVAPKDLAALINFATE